MPLFTQIIVQLLTYTHEGELSTYMKRCLEGYGGGEVSV